MTVAVVGAGLAGLAAAIEAADRGAAVTLYDARESVGGRARTREQNGFLLNEGPHALYVDGEAMAFLRELGCEPSGGVPDAAGGVGVDGGRTGLMPGGVWSLMRTSLLKGDRMSFAKLFAKLARLDPAAYGDVSVDDAVRDLLGEGASARLGHALFRLSTYGNDPAVMSSDAGIAQLQYALGNGVRYLDGGWQSIVDALRDNAERRGVTIEAGAKVTAVDRGDGSPEVIVGESVRSHEKVILAPGGPRHVGGILGDGAVEAGEWAAAARPSTVAGLDVGLRCPWGDAPSFALGIDEPMYLSLHAPVGKLAPDGQALVCVSRYLHPDESPDPARDRTACEGLLDRIRPGWREDADHVGFHRRLVASFDQPKAASGGLAGRPGPEVPGMTDVFIAGDWVGPVGLLADASVASGRAAARLAT